MRLAPWSPLPLSGDHGHTPFAHLGSHEKEEKTIFHITWSRPRAKSLSKTSAKVPIRVRHPWITFRENRGIRQEQTASGTLVFYSHSNRHNNIELPSVESYIDKLKRLPSEYQPVVICLHMHDVAKNLHLDLAKYGLPIITLGETSSQYFVERFYDMVKRFKFATSSTGGSELLYCEELGVKYFIIGEEPTETDASGQIVKNSEEYLTYQPMSMNIEEAKAALFRQFPPTETQEKLIFVSDLLGLDCPRRASAATLWMVLLIESAFNPIKVAKHILGSILRRP